MDRGGCGVKWPGGPRTYKTQWKRLASLPVLLPLAASIVPMVAVVAVIVAALAAAAFAPFAAAISQSWLWLWNVGIGTLAAVLISQLIVALVGLRRYRRVDVYKCAAATRLAHRPRTHIVFQASLGRTHRRCTWRRVGRKNADNGRWGRGRGGSRSCR